MSSPILTAKQGTNADLFPDVLALYAREGDRVLDLTYGRGVFWRHVDRVRYQLVTNDLVSEADHCYDCCNTEFQSGSFDVIVFDPPYMHGGATVKPSINDCYLNANGSHQSVMELYYAGISESWRLLTANGVLIVKCQDETESGKQQLSHVEILSFIKSRWRVLDLFVLVQTATPAMRVRYQRSARKNHSYFIVLRKLRNKTTTRTEKENDMGDRNDRSELTAIVRRVQGMIDHVRENLDDGEYDLFLDLIVPEPEQVVEKVKPKKPKKILHCDACNYTKRHQVHKDSSRSDYHEFQLAQGKSKRAKSIAEAVQKVTKTKVDDIDDDEIFAGQCQFVVNDDTGERCGAVRDDPIHDLTYSSSHEFAPRESAQAASGD